MREVRFLAGTGELDAFDDEAEVPRLILFASCIYGPFKAGVEGIDQFGVRHQAGEHHEALPLLPFGAGEGPGAGLGPQLLDGKQLWHLTLRPDRSNVCIHGPQQRVELLSDRQPRPAQDLGVIGMVELMQRFDEVVEGGVRDVRLSIVTGGVQLLGSLVVVLPCKRLGGENQEARDHADEHNLLGVLQEELLHGILVELDTDLHG
ncbi:MAG: hypothetical protein ABSG68_04140 [Thermoguttaceae bacterium]